LSLDCIVADANRSSIVDVDRYLRLRMSELREDEPENFGFLCIQEEGT